MSFRVINGKLHPIGHFPQSTNKSSNVEGLNNKQKSTFKEILNNKINESSSFKISNHAAERIKLMDLTEADMKKIGEGIKTAEEKGSKNSLILYKDIAFITSIENKTVITAVEKERSKENIYTNIDSVLFL